MGLFFDGIRIIYKQRQKIMNIIKNDFGSVYVLILNMLFEKNPAQAFIKHRAGLRISLNMRVESGL